MNAFNSLSKRERYIAIAVVALGVFFLVYEFVLQPYFDRRDSIAADQKLVSGKLADADQLFAREHKLQPVWNEIKSGGLKTNRSLAESQAQQAVLDWARSAGVNVVSLKPERDQQVNQFQIINFHVQGTGSMLSISNMLWSLETAKIPVRLNDLQITPRKEGTDDLTVQLTISTLCLPPETKADGRSVQ